MGLPSVINIICLGRINFSFSCLEIVSIARIKASSIAVPPPAFKSFTNSLASLVCCSFAVLNLLKRVSVSVE